MLARPLKVLIYLLIILAIVELYRQASTLVLQLTNIVLIFMFAAIVAMLVTPIVDWIQALPVLRGHRGAAVLVLYGAIVIVIGGAVALLAPTVIADASKLGQQVPAIEGAAQHVLDRRSRACALSASTSATRFLAAEPRSAVTSRRRA